MPHLPSALSDFPTSLEAIGTSQKTLKLPPWGPGARSVPGHDSRHGGQVCAADKAEKAAAGRGCKEVPHLKLCVKWRRPNTKPTLRQTRSSPNLLMLHLTAHVPPPVRDVMPAQVPCNKSKQSSPVQTLGPFLAFSGENSCSLLSDHPFPRPSTLLPDERSTLGVTERAAPSLKDLASFAK